jgi:pyruvate/2-oxoglutarate dehydrogenase complex dihydrolipoamide dehydrogenase (E3) component
MQVTRRQQNLTCHRGLVVIQPILKLIVSHLGQSPNTKRLNLENARVEISEKGEIKVHEYSRTTQDNIFL